jgi:hypothetical protein
VPTRDPKYTTFLASTPPTAEVGLEILRWEPDAPVHTTFVIVGLSASLVDPASRDVVWEVYRQPAPVATPGEVTVENAYETAARKVIAEILSPLDASQTAP